MKSALLSATLSVCLGGAALAEGCSLSGGTPIPEIESMNQLILDLRVEDFASRIRSLMNTDVSGAVQSVRQVYADGFTGCTTLLQRRDVGGLTQHLVEFHGKARPLFLYWMSADTEGRFTLIQFYLDSDLDVLDHLR